MRIETITMYSNEAKNNTEKEYIIYTRDELIKHIKDNNIDLKEYALEVYAPLSLQCTIANLERMSADDEFFFNEEDKEITLYMD